MDMDMATSTAAMASSTSMDMGSMATSSGTASASSDMSSLSGMMGMSDMMMVFFTSTNTALYSKDWMPNGAGQYAGTCIFLILLAFIFRGLLAFRMNFLELWHRTESTTYQKGATNMELGAVGRAREPWRINKALTRAILDTVLAGVSYLLMLAVMTMNIGYFMSVLGGVFLGSFVLGGWTSAVAH